MPFLNKNQDQYYYPDEGGDKKKKIILIVGAVVVVLMLLLLLFGGGEDNAGQLSMKQSLETTGETISIIDKYQAELNYGPTKNSVAVIQIILRGNHQKLNDLYKTTYKKAKQLSDSQKIDEKSEEELDLAVKNNVVDTEIIKILEPKIKEAKKTLQQAAIDFEKPSSVELIEVSISDFDIILEELARPR